MPGGEFMEEELCDFFRRSQEKSPIEFIKVDLKKDHVLNYFSEPEEPVMHQKLKAKTFVLAFWRPGVGLQPLPSVHG